MRVRRVRRWAGRLAAVAALGVGATAGVASTAVADEPAPASSETVTQAAPGEVAPSHTSWD